MSNLYKSLKSDLSFLLEKNPRVEKRQKDSHKYIPKPYKGIVIISADFELAWAWRYDKLSNDPKSNCLLMAQKERENVPKLIHLSEKFNIPITWGTVGHLFLDNCQCGDDKPHQEILRLPYFENNWWKFSTGDWFECDPCTSINEAPEWYAKDLVESILASKVKHEIGCHTFSHISCDESVCDPEVIKSELQASKKAASKLGINLKSFIFPGHTMGNYKTIQEQGYSSIRTNFTNTLGYPKRHSNGLWEHKTTMELNYNSLFSEAKNIKRFKKIIDKALKNNQICNFWFHPSFDDINTEVIYPQIFEYLNAHREELWITTMSEYTDWLNRDNQ